MFYIRLHSFPESCCAHCFGFLAVYYSATPTRDGGGHPEMKNLLSGFKVIVNSSDCFYINKRTTFQKINGTAKPDSRLGMGPGGELYIFTKADGRLYKVMGFLQ